MAGSLTYEELQAVFAKYPEYGSIRNFVETGTHLGETSRRMAKHFRYVHTIELSDSLYRKAKNIYARQKLRELYSCRFHGFFGHTMRFYNGDSSSVLPEIIAGINEPIVFFLDGHWSSGVTARGNKDVPLLEELSVISKRNWRDLIVIDDVRLFGTRINEDWCEVTKENILQTFSTSKLRNEFVSNDRLYLLV